MTAVVWRLAPGVPFGKGLKLSAKMMTAIPPVGRMLSGKETSQLILRLVEGRKVRETGEAGAAFTPVSLPNFRSPRAIAPTSLVASRRGRTALCNIAASGTQGGIFSPASFSRPAVG
jgi:hypothetical protein